MTPDQKSLLETVLWAAGLSSLGATARIITHNLPFKLAVGTLFLGVIVGVLVGVVVSKSELSVWVQYSLVSVAAIIGKEVTEMLVRVGGRITTKSDKIADKVIDKVID